MRWWMLLAVLAGLTGAAMAQADIPLPPYIVTQNVTGDTILLVLVYDAAETIQNVPTTHEVNWREVPEMFMGSTLGSHGRPGNPANRLVVNPQVYRQGNPYFPYYQVQARLIPGTPLTPLPVPESPFPSTTPTARR